ncbi:MAG: HAD family hydrolase [Flexilinea sp.]|nr:HAD family hydrolase [Flexilinea sp.]
MIDTVLFDMGGTLEDIFVDSTSRSEAAEKMLKITEKHGYKLDADVETAVQLLQEGWDAYGKQRDSDDRELKPEEIWGNYVMPRFGLNFEQVKPFAEELAYMYEVSHYHRALRPRVKEMLDGLMGMGIKLGIISNTASLYQVFQILEDYGIRDYFRDVTLSSVTGYRKPDGNIFKVSIYQMRSKPENCAYVGDTYSRDIVGATRAGFGKTFHIHSQLTALKDVGTYEEKPTHTISDIYEVYTILKTEQE